MGSAIYEVRIKGSVPRRLLAELGTTSLDHEPAQTVVRTAPTDQAALHGLLARLKASGLEVIEIRMTSEAERHPDDGVDDDVVVHGGVEGVVEADGVADGSGGGSP
jgi:hypothetical protein